MRYRANAKVVSPKGKEIGRVTYSVKAKNRAGAMSKIKKLFNARPHKAKAAVAKTVRRRKPKSTRRRKR